MDIHREITPLKENDCFLVFDRQRKEFNFPIHFHPEYEINFIKNAAGARRIIGDHIGEIETYELVMVGPNIYHGWENHKNTKTDDFHEITIQFPKDIFDSNLLNKNILNPIKKLFNMSNQGILFSIDTSIKVEEHLKSLSTKSGFENYLNFQSLLYSLSISRNKRLLTNISFEQQYEFHNSERIEKIYRFIKNNFHNKIKVEEAAALVNMTVISFTRLIKQRTGKTFVEFVNELRLSYASRKLIETNESISNICFCCGFNNISNFNRVFKKKHKCTPTQFRTNFKGIKNIF